MVDFEFKDKNNSCKILLNDNPGDMTFITSDGKEIFKSTGVELGILKERNGFEERCRLHQGEKNGWYWAETITRHPFGPEPLLKHKYEQAGNHIRVTTDIQISHQMPMENIVIDNLYFYGEWKKITVYSFDRISGKISVDKYSPDNINLTLKHVPLVVLFENSEGFCLEIGTGFDLWRWSIGSRFSAEEKFVICRSDSDVINFRRIIAEWGEEYQMGKKDFRFTWYFSWDSGKNHIKNNYQEEPRELKLGKSGLESVDGNSLNFNLISKCEESVQKSSCKDICYASRQLNNSFKQWLRKLYNSSDDKKLKVSVSCIKPGVCGKISHVGAKNKNKDEMLHFDYPFVLGIWEWANKYLAETGAHLVFNLDDTSVFKDLPSSRGLKE